MRRLLIALVVVLMVGCTGSPKTSSANKAASSGAITGAAAGAAGVPAEKGKSN